MSSNRADEICDLRSAIEFLRTQKGQILEPNTEVDPAPWLENG